MLVSVRYRKPAKNLTKLFSPVALVDYFTQLLKLLVLIRPHGFQIDVSHGFSDGECIAALLHRVCAIGVPSGIGNQLLV